MTLLDANGNTVHGNRDVLARRIKKSGLMRGTFSRDAHGQIMVDTMSGGYIVFFACDEPALTIHVLEVYEEDVEENK